MAISIDKTKFFFQIVKKAGHDNRKSLNCGSYPIYTLQYLLILRMYEIVLTIKMHKFENDDNRIAVKIVFH